MDAGFIINKLAEVISPDSTNKNEGIFTGRIKYANNIPANTTIQLWYPYVIAIFGYGQLYHQGWAATIGYSDLGSYGEYSGQYASWSITFNHDTVKTANNFCSSYVAFEMRE